MLGQAGRQTVVVDGVVRDEAEVVDRELVVRFGIGDDRSQRHLATSARRRGHGDERRRLRKHLEHAGHLLDRLVGLGDARRSALCTVHRRAAAETDERLATVLEVELAHFLDVVDGGVRNRLVVEHRLDARSLAELDRPVDKAQLADHLIGHDDDRVDAENRAKSSNLIGALEDGRLTIGHNGDGSAERRLICATPCFSYWIHVLSFQRCGP